jgi:hypothetical protein
MTYTLLFDTGRDQNNGFPMGIGGIDRSDLSDASK